MLMLLARVCSVSHGCIEWPGDPAGAPSIGSPAPAGDKAPCRRFHQGTQGSRRTAPGVGGGERAKKSRDW